MTRKGRDPEPLLRALTGLVCGLALLVVVYAILKHGQQRFLLHLVIFAVVFLLIFTPLAWFSLYLRTRPRRYRCPQCAEKVRHDARVCRYCGHHLAG